ncbi:MAG: D-alanine--D-alanine ligase [Bradymonadia bacterium]
MSTVKVAVLCGGESNERDVSLRTGAAIERALASRGYEVVHVDVDRQLVDRLKAVQPDVCYNALHGTFGEDGQLQSILDFLGLPYTGENARTSLIAFDKRLTKHVYQAHEVATPDSFDLQSFNTLDNILDDLALPVFLKPCSEGSSVGVEKISSVESLSRFMSEWDPQTPYLVESAVRGAELSVACFGDEILGSVEIVPKREFYDYEAKYGDAGTEYFIPPRLSPADVTTAEEMAFRAHKALGCKGLCRTDVLVGDTGVFVLETNTLPGMTETSLVPKIARAAGIDFPELVERVLKSANRPMTTEVRV